MKLTDVQTEFEKYIVINDPWVLRVILATLIGNTIIDRDPIWSMLVAPSSGGKTTFISPCVGLPNVFFIDDLTEKTLLSGFKIKGKEMSLLNLIGNGIMAFSDFTSILSKNPQSRGEILTQLKLVYDRKVTKYTGTGKSEWEGKIGFLGAATPDIYYMLESSRSMGERFLYYWMNQPGDKEIALKQQEVRMSSKAITELMKDHYKTYCKAVAAYASNHGIPELYITDEQRIRIRDAAIFCVNGKATVHTDFKTGKVDQIPNKAGVGRDNKMFDTMLLTLQLMDAYETDNTEAPVTEEHIQIVEKCAYSSINRERRKILEIICAHGKPLRAAEIGAHMGLDKTSTEKYLLPLHAVGLVQKNTTGAHTWFVRNQKTNEFVNRVSGYLVDATEVQPLLVPDESPEDNLEYGVAEAEANAAFEGIV